MKVWPLSLAAFGVSLVATALVLPRAAPPPAMPIPTIAPIALSPAAPLDDATAATLFTPTPLEPIAPEDAPAVAGIVGRLPDDAVVLVRRAEGGTRSLRPGDTIDGWRLEAVSRDAVLFTRGNRRVRVVPDG